MRVSIWQRGQGIGAIISVFSYFLPATKKLGFHCTINPESWIYFKGKKFDKKKFDKLFCTNESLLFDDPDYLFEIDSIKAFQKAKIQQINFLDVIRLRDERNLFKNFRISCHARFGINEKGEIGKKDLIQRVAPKEKFWEALDESLEKNEKFFLASDNQDFITETKILYPDQVLSYNHTQSGSSPSHKQNENPMLALFEAMQDLTTLSFCETLICNRSALNLHARRTAKKNILIKP